MKLTQKFFKTEKTNPTKAQRAKPNKSEEPIRNVAGLSTEDELWKEVLQDEELRAKHKELLKAKPGYTHLSDAELEDMVDTLLRYAAFLYDLATSLKIAPT